MLLTLLLNYAIIISTKEQQNKAFRKRSKQNGRKKTVQPGVRYVVNEMG